MSKPKIDRQANPIVERLVELQGELLEVFMEEADPKKWPKGDTPEGRGDRAWLKKNALLTGGLVLKMSELRFLQAAEEGGKLPDDIQGMVEEAERDARRLLKLVAGGNRGAQG